MISRTFPKAVIALFCLGLFIAPQRAHGQTQVPKLKIGTLGAPSNAYPHQLSGGMRQRVGIARAFCVEPEVILCDEAFGHLDQVTAIQLRGDFLELVRETRKTSVFITHDMDEAIELGNRVLVLGKPARLLMDLTISDQMKSNLTARDEMKTRILNAIEANRPVD